MNDEARIQTFINSFDKGNSSFLEAMYEEAKSSGIPVIRRETQSFIRTMLKIKDPESILEIGTACGFSAVMMAENTSDGCHITTIENYDKRIAEAKANIRASGYNDKITLLEGDAGLILDELNGCFEFVFMDAAKGQYINFLPKVKSLMKKGSILLADNVLQGGDLLESKYIVERRDRTIYKRMREFLYAVKNDEELETAIISLGDGVSLSVMK